MRLSVAWIFDHIDADWRKININDIVTKFNQTTAEIEGFFKISIDLDKFTLAKVTNLNSQHIQLFSPEWNKEFGLPARKGILLEQWFLIKKENNILSWATAQELGSGKDFVLPSFLIKPMDEKGAWKENFESLDYIIELDNKSITHRPDMWGHRGFAREVAALLELPFKPIEPFLVKKPITESDATVKATETNPFNVTVEAHNVCKSFSGIYISNITWQPSLLSIAHRLVRIDGRPIDALVDMTNYVMFDLGQPMHAFDAERIISKKLNIRMAHQKEKITLLDGETVELTSQDIVVADDGKALGLAGVMGGRDSGITSSTKSILLESACFDATTIRHTAERYKKRSEASARFEKSLDPHQTVLAIERFLKLLDDVHLDYEDSNEIFEIGPSIPVIKISVSHDFIEKRLGAIIDTDFILKTLHTLEFGVELQGSEYIVTVPSFRGTKDVKIKEDIVEEIGRFYGFTNLIPQLPLMELQSKNLDWVSRTRKIKQILAYAMHMRELYNYAFFDEEFLLTLKWQPEHTLEVKSPVSENWRRLVTTLIPGLLKAVAINSAEYDQLRFFELGRIWHHAKEMEVFEKKSLAGILYDKKNPINFYDAKAELTQLFDALKLEIMWQKIDHPHHPWYAPYQTAHLIHQGISVGIAGSMHPTFLNSVCPGSGFIFELDGDFLLHHKDEIKQFVPASKYPEMVRDISLIISVDQTADAIIDLISQIDPKIISVSLIDFFEKSEWPDKRSMTFRFVISDKEKTLTKEEADAIWDNVAASLKQIGATIR
jgi:phenylalanyl-tRNA synthetase beta chain